MVRFASLKPAEADRAFEPEHVTAMADALYDVCEALKIPEERAYERDVIAERIIDLAGEGILDAATLRDRILAEARSSG
jgi:hypothetical protein